jgi:acetyl-CoA carboxylase biotin carboxyl carrier protein
MKKPQAKAAAAAKNVSKTGPDLSIVAALAKIAGQHDLSEVEIEHQGLRVRVARERAASAMTTFVAPAVATVPASTPTEPAEHPGVVKSPMVGTAYRRASPEAKPFVEVGSMVKAGDKVMLVEAMKTFNEILAPKAGKVVEIFVEDATPVEYGQTLLAVE